MTQIQYNPFASVESEDRFEDLCRDLLERHRNFINVQRLKKKGHNQYGVDITADINNDVKTIAAQCKHYIKTKFGKKEIEEAITLFLDYWEDFWEHKRVIEFYLIISQEKNDDKQILEIQTQKERLQKFGITLIDWWHDELIREIRKYPELVKEYLGKYWVAELCPNDFISLYISQFSPGVTNIASAGLDSYQTILDEDLRILIENIREKVRCGEIEQAEEDFINLKEKHFPLVGQKGKTEILSFEIRLFFPNKRSIKTSRQILQQIKNIDSAYNTSYLEALITSREIGYDAALEKIASHHDIQTLNLKLNFFLNLYDLDKFFQLYESEKNKFQYDIETQRLFVLALIANREIERAITVVEEIFLEKPNWENLKLAKATAYYYSGIPYNLVNEQLLGIPLPSALGLIKTDEDSSHKRKISASIFSELLKSESLTNDQKIVYETWYLACLADDIEQQEEAGSYFRSVLEENPTHPYFLLWALNRNYEFNIERSIQAIEQKQLAGKDGTDATEINEGIMYINLCLRVNQFTKAHRQLLRLKTTLNSSRNFLVASTIAEISPALLLVSKSVK